MVETYRRLKTLSKRIFDIHVSVYAGNASFFLMIAAFPALMMLMTLLQYTPLTEADVISALSSVVPSSFQPLLEYFLNDLYASSAGTVISISAVSAIWLASKGVMGVLSGLNAVYGVEETRSYVRRRLISMIYMVALLVALLLTLVLHVFGRKLQALLAQRFAFLAKIFSIALHFRVLVLIGLLSLLFTSCFLALPNRKSRLRSAIPGALLSAVAWVVFSSAFSFYINNFAHYSHFYGSLTTLVVSMLWLFFCMNILFYGGMVNARLEQRRQRRKTVRRQRPS
jgi:membrane protein